MDHEKTRHLRVVRDQLELIWIIILNILTKKNVFLVTTH